jgi:methyl-accepting chemotaxis protein
VWLGTGVLLTMLAASMLVAVVLIRGLTNHEQRLNDRSIPYATAVAQAALAAKGAANDERGFLLFGDHRFIDEAGRRIASARAWLTASAVADSGTAERRAITAAHAGVRAMGGCDSPRVRRLSSRRPGRRGPGVARAGSRAAKAV